MRTLFEVFNRNLPFSQHEYTGRAVTNSVGVLVVTFLLLSCPAERAAAEIILNRNHADLFGRVGLPSDFVGDQVEVFHTTENLTAFAATIDISRTEGDDSATITGMAQDSLSFSVDDIHLNSSANLDAIGTGVENPPGSGASADGFGGASLSFDITGNTEYAYTLTGLVEADGTGRQGARIQFFGTGISDSVIVGTRFGIGLPTTDTIGSSGVLTAGSYTVNGELQVLTGAKTDSSATFDFNFDLRALEPGENEEPAEGGTKFRWLQPTSGSSLFDANWDPKGVPGENGDNRDVMLVDVDGDFTINSAPDRVIFRIVTKQSTGTVTFDPDGDFVRAVNLFVKSDTRLVDGEFSAGFESFFSQPEKTSLVVRDGATMTVGQGATLFAGYDIVDPARIAEDLPFESVLVGLSAGGEQLIVRDGARFTADGVDLRTGDMTVLGSTTEVKLMNLTADGSGGDIASLSLSGAASLQVGRLANFALASDSVFDGNVSGAGTTFTGLDGVVGPRSMIVGVAGDAKLDVSQGALVQVGRKLIVGEHSSAIGELAFSGSSQLALPTDGGDVDIVVGQRGQGTLRFESFAEIQNEHLAGFTSLIIGEESTGNGTVLFDGPALTSNGRPQFDETFVGGKGEGLLELRNNTVFETRTLKVGAQLGGRGQVLVDGSALLINETGFVTVGGGEGSVGLIEVINNGAFSDIFASSYLIGSGTSGGRGTMRFGSSTTGLVGSLSIGERSSAFLPSARTGSFEVRDGATVVSDKVAIGNRGELTVLSASLLVNGDLLLDGIGEDGPGGLVSVVGGALGVTGRIEAANSTWEFNSQSLATARSLNLRQSSLNVEGTSTFTTSMEVVLEESNVIVDGQGSVVTSGLFFAADSQLQVSDEARINATDISISSKSTALLSFGGGILVNDVFLVDDSMVELNGDGSMSAGRLTVQAAANLRAVNGSEIITGDMSVTGGGATTLLDNSSAGVSNDLMVSGSSSLRMFSGSIFSVAGNTTIVDSAVQLAGAGTQMIVADLATSNATVTVDDFALLSGNQLNADAGSILRGTNGGRLQFQKITIGFGATVIPGKSPGQLTLDGETVFEAGSTLILEIGGTTPVLDYDILEVLGDLTFEGLIQFVFIDGFAPQRNEQFEFLMTNGAVDLTGAQFEVVNLAPGFLFEITPSAAGMTVTALNDGVFVPEPNTICLLLLSAAALVARSRGPVQGACA